MATRRIPLAPTTTGYSGTPLAKKLGIGAGTVVAAVDAPDDYAALLAPLPTGARIVPQIAPDSVFVHLFCRERAVLAQRLAEYRRDLGTEAVFWVSWPKKSAKQATDIGEDTIRALALPLGWVDVKVCAVDATWSALKLVVRKALR